jgi:photosystem II stability/assembly factor-like uncharacterized protein
VKTSSALSLTAAVVFTTAFLLSGFTGDTRPVSPKHGTRSGALQALEFFSASRAHPDADIPADGYTRAAEQLRSAFPAPSSPGSSPQWRFLGPVNFSGRMVALEFNPLNGNTLYAGAAAGGLWRTRNANAGGDWTRITLGNPVLGVSAITVHPADTNTIYVGTGEVYRYKGSVGGIVIRTTRGSFGMGILKTTDGGTTWARSLDWSYNQERGVQRIRINPRNTAVVYAATSEGILKSTNAGGSWVPVAEILMVRDILIHPTDTAKVLAAAGNFGTPGSGVYRSTDGGANWNPVPGLSGFTGYPMLEMWRQDPNVVFASLPDSTSGSGRLYRSVDFGVTWSALSTQAVYGVQGWYSQFVAVHPTDTLRVVRGGQSIWRSADGGRNSVELPYTTVAWADFHHYAHQPGSPGTLFIADDGGVWRSPDFGTTYPYVGQGLQTSQFYNGFSASAQDSARALGHVQDHFGYMYTGSVTWPEGGVDEVGWTGINQLRDSIMYAVSRNGGAMYRSTDRGITYASINTGISGGTRAWNAPFVISPTNPNILYFGRSRIFRSTNGGTNWALAGTGDLNGTNPALSMAVAATNSNVVFVGLAPLVSAAKVFRTTNGGTSWTDVTGPMPDRYPMDIAIDPSSDSVVYVAYGGFNAPHFFRSTDRGNSWTNITGLLPDVPGTAVAVDPFVTSHLYAGTDLGVFVSTNRGTTWAPFNDGLPEAVIVADLVVSPSNRSLKLATHSNGVYERSLLSRIGTSVGGGEESPLAFRLEQNFPNPFNPSTTVSWSQDRAGAVRLSVLSITGSSVEVLADGVREAGRHSVRWSPRALASGVYLLRLEAEGRAEVRKMTYIR